MPIGDKHHLEERYHSNTPREGEGETLSFSHPHPHYQCRRSLITSRMRCCAAFTRVGCSPLRKGASVGRFGLQDDA